ncbi:MAG: ATP-binding cassette domain-containing protein [Actinobacteria bacterium]|nr:ATP-binding cassette domain-containing protein [Actinomycetota bacterium]
MRKPEFEVPNPLSLFMGERQAAGSRGPRRLRGTVRPNHGQRPHPPDFDPLRGAGLVRAERIARAEGVLAEVGLHGVARTYPWQLSGEMQQRVAIARALVSRPDVLLLDEPFASVDALTRAELQDLLLRVHGGIEHGRVTIVHVTHDIDEAVYLADRVLVLGAAPGRVVGSIPRRRRRCRWRACRHRPRPSSGTTRSSAPRPGVSSARSRSGSRGRERRRQPGARRSFSRYATRSMT